MVCSERPKTTLWSFLVVNTGNSQIHKNYCYLFTVVFCFTGKQFPQLPLSIKTHLSEYHFCETQFSQSILAVLWPYFNKQDGEKFGETK